AGNNLTYTVTVSNAGPSDAVNVVVTDTLPAGVTFVSTTGCAEDPNGVPTCILGTIAAGASAMYTITVTVDSSTTGTLTNSATVASGRFRCDDTIETTSGSPIRNQGDRQDDENLHHVVSSSRSLSAVVCHFSPAVWPTGEARRERSSRPDSARSTGSEHPVKHMSSQIKVRSACDKKIQPIIQIASAGWKFWRSRLAYTR
ncbi:MAG: DUF11 domain-containing protein, partial [Acidimicrobiia bacterium]